VSGSDIGTADRTRDLGRVLASELPITQHLGIAVARADADGVELALPLAPNRNHQGTMFAGSLNAVATLAGWAVVWLVVARAGLAAGIVIQDSTIDYLRPVTGDCLARCEPPLPAAREQFLAALARHRRARLALSVAITVGEKPAARFHGRFVALARAGGTGRSTPDQGSR
jgi:thioesterase domain-containing protein